MKFLIFLTSVFMACSAARADLTPNRLLKKSFLSEKPCENPNDFEGRFSKTWLFQHPAKEFETLKAKAKTGDSDAEFQLGKCYHEGIGADKNKTEALNWFEKAAEHGIVEAQMMVGISYWNGIYVKMDEKKGVGWFERAAKQGEPGAMYFLGAAYYLGKGVKQDFVQSYKWSLVFKDSGRSVIPDDTASLDNQIADLEQKMTADQIKTGKEMAEKLKKELSKTPWYSESTK